VLVFLFWHDCFSFWSLVLRAVRRVANVLSVISLDKKAACTIILVCLGYFMVLPIRAIIISHKPFSGAAFRSRLMPWTGKIKCYGIAMFIKIHIFDVNIFALTEKFFHQCL